MASPKMTLWQQSLAGKSHFLADDEQAFSLAQGHFRLNRTDFCS